MEKKETAVNGKRRKRKMILIVAGVLLLVLIIGQGLYLAGLSFAGPLKHLTVAKLTSRYDPAKYQGGVIFYGASNFARWSNMEADILQYPVQNHGFGGSTDRDLMRYADELLYPYSPKIVVFQTGSNDYVQAEGTDAEKVQACMLQKQAMFEQFHEKLPNAKFIVMSGLLLPGRSEYLALTQAVNSELKALCAATDYLLFVDASDMTCQDGAFRTELFVEGGIHLNEAGQKLWANAYIIPALDAVCAEGSITFETDPASVLP